MAGIRRQSVLGKHQCAVTEAGRSTDSRCQVQEEGLRKAELWEEGDGAR